MMREKTKREETKYTKGDFSLRAQALRPYHSRFAYATAAARSQRMCALRPPAESDAPPAASIERTTSGARFLFLGS
jgi:hypothetical protein